MGNALELYRPVPQILPQMSQHHVYAISVETPPPPGVKTCVDLT